MCDDLHRLGATVSMWAYHATLFSWSAGERNRDMQLYTKVVTLEVSRHTLWQGPYGKEREVSICLETPIARLVELATYS
jgi:hypothetical protein